MSSQSTLLPDLVNFDRVGLRYGRGPEVLIDATLDLPQGSFTFLTGPSGAGKTSLLKLCYLSLKPSRGLIRMFGRDTSLMTNAEKQAIKRRIGVVLQDFHLVEHLSVYENVALPLRVAGQARSSYNRDLIELLDWVGLGDRLQAYPPTLSGGEKPVSYTHLTLPTIYSV